ncbi:hypothetical protein D3C80_873940 [compost metagenome]
MLQAQYPDRWRCLAAHALLQHREQHLFFLEHVPFEFLLHVFKVVGQAIGAVAAGTVYLFHAPGQTDQFRQLLAVAIVIARENVCDQFGFGRVPPVVGIGAAALQFEQGFSDQDRVQVFTQGGFAQGFLPAATEVQVEAVENARGARDVAGQLTEAVFEKCLAHQGSLVWLQRSL